MKNCMKVIDATFAGFLFATTKVASITAMIFFYIIDPTMLRYASAITKQKKFWELF